MELKKIWAEINDVLKVEHKDKEPNRRYLKRVGAALTAMPDTTEALNRLSDDAKAFITPSFAQVPAGVKTPKEDLRGSINNNDKETKVKKTTKTKGKAKVAKSAKKGDGKVRGSLIRDIKVLVFKNQGASTDAILEMMKKKGVKVSKATVQTQRSGFLHSMNLLRELGALKA